jgi:hypothetical protein
MAAHLFSIILCKHHPQIPLIKRMAAIVKRRFFQAGTRRYKGIIGLSVIIDAELA